jgi:two-component system chemotaxis response regulator CheB
VSSAKKGPPPWIVVVGGSAGAIDAVSQLVSGLPLDFPAAFVVVVHFPGGALSVLPQILNRHSALVVESPRDAAPIRSGRVYVGPPDQHLVVTPTTLCLMRGPRENGVRPSIDVLFRSAAKAFGPGVVGIVLSGMLDDGAAGLAAIKRADGIAIVQDPADATFPAMPEAAMRAAPPDYVVRVGLMAALLTKLTSEAPPSARPELAALEEELVAATIAPPPMRGDDHRGMPAPFSCPDCGGTLWELDDDDVLRFRCRVGHGWTAESLLSAKDGVVEESLWAAVRALEEQADLFGRMSRRAGGQGARRVASHYEDRRVENAHHAEHMRRLLGEGHRPG